MSFCAVGTVQLIQSMEVYQTIKTSDRMSEIIETRALRYRDILAATFPVVLDGPCSG